MDDPSCVTIILNQWWAYREVGKLLFIRRCNDAYSRRDIYQAALLPPDLFLPLIEEFTPGRERLRVEVVAVSGVIARAGKQGSLLDLKTPMLRLDKHVI